MLFCRSVSTVSAVSTLIGGRDTPTLTTITEIHLNFLHSRGSGGIKTWFLHPIEPLSETFTTYYYFFYSCILLKVLPDMPLQEIPVSRM